MMKYLVRGGNLNISNARSDYKYVSLLKIVVVLRKYTGNKLLFWPLLSGKREELGNSCLYNTGRKFHKETISKSDLK